jgi:hypothetical protein
MAVASGGGGGGGRGMGGLRGFRPCSGASVSPCVLAAPRCACPPRLVVPHLSANVAAVRASEMCVVFVVQELLSRLFRLDLVELREVCTPCARQVLVATRPGWWRACMWPVLLLRPFPSRTDQLRSLLCERAGMFDDSFDDFFGGADAVPAEARPSLFFYVPATSR